MLLSGLVALGTKTGDSAEACGRALAVADV